MIRKDESLLWKIRKTKKKIKVARDSQHPKRNTYEHFDVLTEPL